MPPPGVGRMRIPFFSHRRRIDFLCSKLQLALHQECFEFSFFSFERFGVPELWVAGLRRSVVCH